MGRGLTAEIYLTQFCSTLAHCMHRRKVEGEAVDNRVLSGAGKRLHRDTTLIMVLFVLEIHQKGELHERYGRRSNKTVILIRYW